MINTVLPKSSVEFPSVSHDSVPAASLRGYSAPAPTTSDTTNAFSTTVAASPTPPTSFTLSPGRRSTTRSKTDSRAPASSRPHVCPDCQRQYSRSEHLARHIQSHTLGKRFQCSDCGKAFARTDLLRRHAQSHKNEDGSKRRRIGAGAPRAGRVSHACKQCSTARVKCEETKPCTHCRLRNLICEYNANEAALALYNPHLKASAPGGLTTTASSSLRRPLKGGCEGEIEESISEPAPRSMPELIYGSKSTLKLGTQASPSVSPMQALDGLENPSVRLLPIPVETLETPITIANFQQQAQQQPQKQVKQQQQQPPAQPPDSVLFQLRQPEMPFSSMNIPGSDFYCPEASNNDNTREIPGAQVTSPESRLEYQRAHPTQQSQSGVLTQSAQDFQSQAMAALVLPSSTMIMPQSNVPPDEITLMPISSCQMDVTQEMPQFCISQSISDIEHMSFSDFLRDVIYESQMEMHNAIGSSVFPTLDFYGDANLDLGATDYGLINSLNVDKELVSKNENSCVQEEGLNLIKFRHELNFLWSCDFSGNCSDPGHSCWGEDPSQLEQKCQDSNSLLIVEESRKKLCSIFTDKISPKCRDAVVSLLSQGHKMQDTFEKMSTSFPSLEALDGFAYIYLSESLQSLSNFIHFPTLKFSSQSPHWIASIIAYGAVLIPLPTARRFGFAVQESVRISNRILVESKINKSLDLDLFQATVILQDLAMWSGNRATMSTADSHIAFPVSILRYQRKYQRLSYPIILVHPDDYGKVLESKWRQWSQQESWKRLVYHSVIKDAEVSTMATTTPRVSYEELNLPLPESKDLWLAKTATEWKELYLKCWSGQTSKLPSAVDLLKDVSLLTNYLGRLDIQLSVSIYLSGSATLSHQYHQLCGIQCSRPFVTRNLAGRSHNLLNERHQELCKELRDFQQLSFQWGPQNALLVQQNVMLHLQLMQLHISINDVYLFTGREGEDQIRNSYVILRQWTRSTEAREALWHAGQTLRYAKMLPPGTMKDFWCITVVQAGLAFWVYGIITKASKKPQENHSDSNSAAHLEDGDMRLRDNFVPHIPGCYVNEPLFLDGENNTAVMRYLSMGQGQPFIRGPAPRNPSGGDSNSNAMLQASPEDPRACIGLLYNIMMDNFGWDIGRVPLLVHNMVNFMKRLSAIAARVHS
ncbi:hypothetical protein Cpir12675_000768 [Ceratocystis pirilliformis]|uniref:Uncharacterized protein n=1 Tax=Ceratocystis pirilliformis TaxID=259994 RepID=A0ABR3ZK10_9PEZI